MIDKKLEFGTIAMATKAIAVYSADVLDFSTTKAKTGIVNDAHVVFVLQDDLASADSFSPQLWECDTVGGAKTLLYQGASASGLLAGDRVSIPMPLSHKRYVWAGALPASSGTFTATDLKAAIELGSVA